MFDMVHRGLIAVKDRRLRMTMCDLSLMRGQLEMFFVAMFGGLIVMARRLIVMVGCGGVVFGAGQVGFGGFWMFGRPICLFDLRALHMLRIIYAGFVCVISGLHRMSMGGEGLMRRMFIILAGFKMPGRLMMISRRLFMMKGGQGVVSGGFILCGHDVYLRIVGHEPKR